MERHSLVVATVLVASVLVGPPAAADHCAPGDNGCHGTNRSAGALVDETCATSVDAVTGSMITRFVIPVDATPPGTVTGFCVYLPPGYGSSGLRYPVMYLLHGGAGDQADWVDKGEIRRIMDARHADDPSQAMIVVMPDADSNGVWANTIDGSLNNETYVLDVLVPWVDENLRTIPDRSGRVIEGLSNGGYGSMHLAAKAPDAFVSAGGMSSDLELPSWWPAFGNGAYQQGQTPRALAMNLRDVGLVLHTGVACEPDDYTRDGCVPLAIELLFLPMHEFFVDALKRSEHPEANLHYEPTWGEHAWKYWQRWLEGPQLDWHLERIQRATADPVASATPDRWRYTSVSPTFSVWGWTFATDPARAPEFLTVTDVHAGGLTLTGSGRTTVTTAALYRPNTGHAVGDALVTSDDDGRLTFDVDLGPPHTLEQFTPAQRVAEASGDYWETVSVTIEEAGP